MACGCSVYSSRLNSLADVEIRCSVDERSPWRTKSGLQMMSIFSRIATSGYHVICARPACTIASSRQAPAKTHISRSRFYRAANKEEPQIHPIRRLISGRASERQQLTHGVLSLMYSILSRRWSNTAFTWISKASLSGSAGAGRSRMRCKCADIVSVIF